MFDRTIQGHLATRERLLNRLSEGRFHGSFLFVGPEGIGKRRVALELAQRELCFRKNACGECEGCRMFKGETLPVEFPNLLRIAPEGKAGVIKIGVIREDDLVEGGVIRWAYQSPLPGTHRWILIEDAHRLNGPSANMLLKTMEEPPSDTHFLLITHRPEATLQTIRSRCERIIFTPLSDAEAWAVAQSAGWPLDEYERWTALAGGSLRYLDTARFQLAVAQLEAWMSLCEGQSFVKVSTPLLPDKTSEKSQNEQLTGVFELLLRILDDVVRMREGLEIRLKPWHERVQAIARSPLQIKGPVDAVHEAMRVLNRNPFAESLIREVVLQLQ